MWVELGNSGCDVCYYLISFHLTMAVLQGSKPSSCWMLMVSIMDKEKFELLKESRIKNPKVQDTVFVISQTKTPTGDYYSQKNARIDSIIGYKILLTDLKCNSQLLLNFDDDFLEVRRGSRSVYTTFLIK